MRYEIDKDGCAWPPPAHEWFGLSYSAYFVMPRMAIEAMPHEWQRRFIALMDEAEAADLNTPDYYVLRQEPYYTTVKKYDEDDETSRDFEFTAWFEDPWANYRRGNIEDLCPEFQIAKFASKTGQPK